MREFFQELKRRKVYRAGVAYLVAAFVVLQLADLAANAFGFPPWFGSMVWVLCGLGLPLALVLAWAFEMTPEGVRRTPASEEPAEHAGELAKEEARPTEARGSRGRRAVGVLVGLGLVAAAIAGGWYLMGGGGKSPEITDRTVAVLPFETLGREETTAFTDGMQTEILSRLSSISGLVVSSRTSVMQYRESGKSLPEIGRELGVSWVVRGEVQESGDQVQVNARLVNTRRDEQIWTEIYRRNLTAENLFGVQEEITKEIARELQTQLSPRERERVESRPTGSLAAYNLAVRARSLLYQRTGPEMRQAARLFERAIERDSTYALAWVGLADALTQLASYGHANPDTVLPEAQRAARRALNLEPQSAEAHASLGMIRYGYGEGSKAVDQLHRAVELRPSYAEAHSWLSWLYLLLGKPAEALQSGRQAVNLDRVSPEPMLNFAFAHLAFDRPDSLLAAVEQVQDLQPDYATAMLYEATALHRLGRLERARSRLRGLRVSWAPSAPLAGLAVIDVATGDSSSAQEKLSRLEEEAETPFYAGLIHAALGDHATALTAFEQVDSWATEPWLAWPILSLRYLYPDVLGPLRADPRFEELIREINQAWGLNPDGSLPDSIDVSFNRQADE